MDNLGAADGGWSGSGSSSGKPGDWDCPSCQHLNFARRTECRNCGAAKESSESGGSFNSGGGSFNSGGGRPGDWVCPTATCRFNNFAKNRSCLKCGALKSGGGDGGRSHPYDRSGSYNSHSDYGGDYGYGNSGGGGGGFGNNMKKGDWMCTCGELVFASRPACRQCGAAKPTPAQGGHNEGSGNAGGGYGGKFGGKPGDWNCPDCGELCFASRTHCRKCNTPKP